MNAETTADDMSDESIVDRILKRFDKLEKKVTSLDDKSWSLYDCASFMQVSYATALRMSKQPGFPTPTRPQTDNKGNRIAGRYNPDEFKEWFWSRANRAS